VLASAVGAGTGGGASETVLVSLAVSRSSAAEKFLRNVDSVDDGLDVDNWLDFEDWLDIEAWLDVDNSPSLSAFAVPVLAVPVLAGVTVWRWASTKSARPKIRPSSVSPPLDSGVRPANVTLRPSPAAVAVEVAVEEANCTGGVAAPSIGFVWAGVPFAD